MPSTCILWCRMFLSKRMNCLLSKWVLFTTVTLSTRPTDVKLDSAFLTRVLCTVLCPEIDSHAVEKCAKIICTAAAANMICFAPLLKIMIHQLSRNFIVGLAYKSQATFFLPASSPMTILGSWPIHCFWIRLYSMQTLFCTTDWTFKRWHRAASNDNHVTM